MLQSDFTILFHSNSCPVSVAQGHRRWPIPLGRCKSIIQQRLALINRNPTKTRRVEYPEDELRLWVGFNLEMFLVCFISCCKILLDASRWEHQEPTSKTPYFITSGFFCSLHKLQHLFRPLLPRPRYLGVSFPSYRLGSLRQEPRRGYRREHAWEKAQCGR